MFETIPRDSMNRAFGAVLIAFSLFLSGCTTENEKPLDPLEDEDEDGLSNGWEMERGFDPRNASDVLICQGQAKFCERQYDNHTFPETHNSFSTVEDEVWLALNPTLLYKRNGMEVFELS